MSEVIRFKLGNRSRHYRGADVISGPDIGDDEIFLLREDRATETERAAVALRLAELNGEAIDYKECAGARKEFNEQADELLSLVFGEGASRG